MVVNPSAIAGRLRRSYDTDLGSVGAFLPARVPVDELPATFAPFVAACQELPARYPGGQGGVRVWLDREFRRDDPQIRRAMATLSPGQAEGLMTALCALGHTYRWDTVPPVAARFAERRIMLPPGIAGPWGQLARDAGRPRVGSVWSLHLTNWTMLDRPGGAAYRAEDVTRPNLRIARNWLAPPVDAHLENFSLSFVLMEALGAGVLRPLVETIEAAAARRVDDTAAGLERLRMGLAAMTLGFSMNVRRRTVDPAIWLELIQPTYAWSAYAEDPGRIEGGPSGMQLGIIQALDAGLGVEGRSTLSQLATTARRGMPVPHRRFLRALDAAGPLVRSFVTGSRSAELTARFDACVAALSSFRVTHRVRGALYLRSRPPGDVARTSTGLTIGVDDEPLAVFEQSMTERIDETRSAMFNPGRREQSEPRVVQT
jgi:indoleamine 2,3-dioxygenase